MAFAQGFCLVCTFAIPENISVDLDFNTIFLDKISDLVTLNLVYVADSFYACNHGLVI